MTTVGYRTLFLFSHKPPHGTVLSQSNSRNKIDLFCHHCEGLGNKAKLFLAKKTVRYRTLLLYSQKPHNHCLNSLESSLQEFGEQGKENSLDTGLLCFTLISFVAIVQFEPN